jgi:GalNAc-alpha-(1->4)-GalNAc-alpha-(1->3)-diNAcBac-PP-undecaprenol alpha-1,4-N-acetyl-D-galactosaminyltransferase
MAVCEALACGVPVVSFNCPSGPSVIIRDGLDGLLVPSGDISSLTAAMNRLMTNDAERRAMAARAPEVMQRFGISKILRMWDELFGQLGVSPTYQPNHEAAISATSAS